MNKMGRFGFSSKLLILGGVSLMEIGSQKFAIGGPLVFRAEE